MEQGVVYFIKGGDAIKIGFSRDFERRFKRLASSSAMSLELLGTVPGGMDLERHLHKELGEFRRHGEWFDDCEEVRTRLKSPPDIAPVAPIVQSPFTCAVMQRAKIVFRFSVAKEMATRTGCTLRTAEYWMKGRREMGLECFVTLLKSDVGSEFLDLLHAEIKAEREAQQ